MNSLDSIKKIDGSESSTAKGVNITAEFNNLKMFTLIKKLLHIRSKEYKLRNIKYIETDKISLSCFDDKRQVLDNGVHTLAYFQKDSHKL